MFRRLGIVLFTVAILFTASCSHFKRRLQLSSAERDAIDTQEHVFSEIMELYALASLDRPKDLTLCAREMFTMSKSNACRDRFSRYLPPQKANEERDESAGKFFGFGLHMWDIDDKVVISPIPGTPAEQVGIKMRDTLVSIDGVSVSTVAGCQEILKTKPSGSVVILRITRLGIAGELEFKIKRATTVIHSVSSNVIDAEVKIGMVKVSGFIETTPKDFELALRTLRSSGVSRLIIDVRDNPGGLLDSCIRMLANFMTEKDTATVIRYRDHEDKLDAAYLRQQYDIKEFGKYREMRLVILINNESASASEMFTGAMKDWGYPVFGETSFGKGVGQDGFSLSDGSELRLTTFEFLVGNHRVVIRDKGVTPTVEVTQSPDAKYDVLLVKAVEFLRNQ